MDVSLTTCLQYPKLFDSVKGGKPYQTLARPMSYGVQQDGPGNYLVSSDGTTISLIGNSWKGFPIQKHVVSLNSILEFDLQVEETAEGHGKRCS